MILDDVSFILTVCVGGIFTTVWRRNKGVTYIGYILELVYRVLILIGTI